MAKVDFYAEVSNRIASELEKGTVPWVRPWSSVAGAGVPMNAISNRPYSGGNIVVIWMASYGKNWPTSRFLTFKQAKEAGGHVRKGEKGITVFFMMKTKLAKDKGDESKKEFMLVKTYTVFNVAQCDGLPERITEGKSELQKYIDDSNRISEAEEFIEETGAQIGFGGDRAMYIPSIDAIQMPLFKTFKNADNYYATMFHELGHWTGDKKRLARDLTGRFGTEAYAAEELVAELTSAFLCAEFGFDGDVRHASYIANWIKLLKEDKRAFFTAASKASAAAEYLRGLALEEEELAEAA